MCVGVRVDDDLQPVALPHLMGEPLGLGGQTPPLRGRQRAVLQHLARLVVPPERRDDDEVFGAHRLGERRDVRDMRPGGVPDLGTAVQSGEDGAGRHGEPAPRGLLLEYGRIRGQIAVGAQLDPLVPGLGDLVEEALPGDLLGIVGEPHAPGVRSRTDPDAGQ